MPKPSLSPSTIHDMLQQRWGTIADFSPIAEGLDSQAFSFRHGAADYVVRINQSIDGFTKDQFVYRRFTSPGLPIPAVLDVGHLDGAHAFCVSGRLPGRRLHDVDAAHLSQLVDPTVQLMATIAAADMRGTHGFGRFDSTGIAPYARWHDFLTGIADPERYDWVQAGRTAHMPMVHTLCRLVAQLAAQCPEERRLIHGDFGSYNVLTDGQRITAVLDWDRALFGDPLYDVANLLFWQEGPLRPLIERVEQQGHTVQHWHERVCCYQLRIGLQEIYESAMGIGPINLAWLTIRCNAIVEQHAWEEGRGP
jgi:hygromycin-B 4-O-kinase